MALGDIAIDARGGLHSAGNLRRVTGTIEASDTATEFAILPNSFIIDAQLFDIDDGAVVKVVRNSDDGTEDSQAGSIYVQTSNNTVETLRFNLLYI